MNPLHEITPLDPQNLTASASLNRVRIMDLPGMTLEEEVKGRKGNDLLSAPSLAAAILESAEALHLSNVFNAATDHIQLPLLLDKCFESANPQVRMTAEGIACKYGRRLGYLIATLKRGDRINRLARPEWDDSYWQYWAGIHRIKLGGGLVSGNLGPLAVKQARQTLEEAGVLDCMLSLAEYPAVLPLLGAARAAPPGAAEMLVFDFGNSFTKRALASYENGTLTTLRTLSRHAGEWITCPDDMDPATCAHNLADYMVGIMAETWKQASHSSPNLAPHIAAIIASYVYNGQPDPLQIGPYGNLRRITTDVTAWFSQALADRLARPITIDLLHDATAAAKTYAGKDARHTAVITLGTFLGVGFPPPGEGLRPIAHSVNVS